MSKDPPRPTVSSEAFRLRVAKETVRVVPKNGEGAPAVTCTIEASNVRYQTIAQRLGWRYHAPCTELVRNHTQ